MFTWNQRTGHLDDFASNTGLEFVAWVLAPGKWVKVKAVTFWEDYIALFEVREENDELRIALDLMSMQLSASREEAAEVERLRRMLALDPLPHWTMMGARVIAHRLGPAAALETALLDKGSSSMVLANAPVVTPQGVAGRIIKRSAHASSVLLVTDVNSRIAVLGQEHRTQGILVGRGPGGDLELLYVPQNAQLDIDEILITSGLAGIFPKGLPVARVKSAERSSISLFQKVSAEALVDLDRLEEVLVLSRPGPDPMLDDAWFGR